MSVRCASGGAPNLVHLRVVSPAGATQLAETRTVDGTGRLRLATIPAGQWTLLAASDRCGLIATPLSVPGESGQPLALLLPAASRLVVRVPALQTSDAIARLTLQGGDGRALQTLEMGGNLKAEWPLVAGSATLGAVPAGSWTLSVQAPDGRSWTASVVTDGRADAQASLE